MCITLNCFCKVFWAVFGECLYVHKLPQKTLRHSWYYDGNMTLWYDVILELELVVKCQFELELDVMFESNFDVIFERHNWKIYV